MPKVLPTYNPNWEATWDRIKADYDAICARIANGEQGLNEEREEIGTSLQRAYNAQYRTAQDYLAGLANRQPITASGRVVAWPPLGPDATIKDIDEAHSEAMEAARRVDAAERALEEGLTTTGLFGRHPVSGMTRTIREAVIPWRVFKPIYQKRPDTHTTVIEDRLGVDRHIALVEHQTDRPSFYRDEAVAVAAEWLLRKALSSPAATRPGLDDPDGPPITIYTYYRPTDPPKEPWLARYGASWTTAGIKLVPIEWLPGHPEALFKAAIRGDPLVRNTLGPWALTDE